ncbi:MAG: long-chain fatty acid--CoA ligase, partial [Solirubrobacterales bacterium]
MESAIAERYATGGPGKGIDHQNLFRALEATVEKHRDAPAIRTVDDSVSITWEQLRDRAVAIAGGLSELGVNKGDTVALLLNGGPDFMPIDLGAVALGAVPFSIYQTSAPEQIQYVCSDSETKLIFIEPEFLESFEEIRDDLPALEHVIVVGGEGGTHTLAEIEASGDGFDVEPSVSAVEPDDLLTLIYTSGTTGPPKGVQLTHRNLLTLGSSIDGIVPFPEEGGKVISWLPAAHIAERGAHYYLPVSVGLTVTICPDPREIIDFLPRVRPTWFFAVPRIWEKLKAGLESVMANLPDEERELAQKGLEAALTRVRAEQAGEPVPAEIAAAAKQADEQLFAGMRERLGLDQAVAVNVGAAPTPLEVLEFFHAIGIEVGELWGMSETCGVATLNPPERVKLGTVGPPVPGCEIKLADDGEVLVRTPANMRGYRNMPEKNAETFDSEGWLLTGDIGEIDEDGYLKIVDRKKELIINAAGKNMSPVSIESKLKAASPLIGQVCAIGDRRPFNVALIVLDPDFTPGWAKKKGLDSDPGQLATDEQLLEAIQEGVDAANAKMARVE